MADAGPRSPAAALRVLTLLILIFLAISQWLGEQGRFNDIDFFQLWGVGAAEKLSGHSLGSPYKESERYAVVLKDYAAAISDASLKTASAAWPSLALTASPLLYVSFSFLPIDYAVAVGLFRGLQVLLFLLAFSVLGIRYRYDGFQLACLALLFVLFFGPFRSDLRVGNVGSIQLFGLAVLLALAEYLADGRPLRHRTAVGTLLLAGSAALTLAKPTVAVVTALIAVHLWIRHGARFFARVAIPTAAVSLILLVIPCLYFGSSNVWFDWYAYFTRSGAAMPASVSIAQGDYASPLLVGRWLGTTVRGVALTTAAALMASLLGVIVVSRPSLDGAAPSRAAAVGGALRKILGDPRLVITGGVVLTIAILPLFWYHYYVLVLIPALWLLNGSRPSDGALGLAAILLSSGMAIVLFAPLGWTAAVPVTVAASWLPLWCAILVQARAAAVQASATPALPKGSADLRRGEPARARKENKPKPPLRR